MRRVMVVMVLGACGLLACGKSEGGGGKPVNAAPPPAAEDSSTSCVVDGQKVSFSDFQGWLGQIVVDQGSRSERQLPVGNGSFGGTEERYSALKKSNGDVYEFSFTRTPTHHHYELRLVKRGNGVPIAPASPEPQIAESFRVDGQVVDKPTFERLFATLAVDAEPWISGHMKDMEGHSGGSSTYEARERATGALWTYHVSSVGRQAERTLTSGSRKGSSARIQ